LLPPSRSAPLRNFHAHGCAHVPGHIGRQASFYRSVDLPLFPRILSRPNFDNCCAGHISCQPAGSAGAASFARRRPRGRPSQPNPHPRRPRASHVESQLRIPSLAGIMRPQYGPHASPAFQPDHP
jgi:hypothetical protein